MTFQRVFSFECTRAVGGVTFVGPLVGVGFEVDFQVAWEHKRPATVHTKVIFLSGLFAVNLLTRSLTDYVFPFDVSPAFGLGGELCAAVVAFVE
jgi:hypothetical protein